LGQQKYGDFGEIESFLERYMDRLNKNMVFMYTVPLSFR
jgi:hypothetical protein